MSNDAYVAHFRIIGADFRFLSFSTRFLRGSRHPSPLVAGIAFRPVAAHWSVPNASRSLASYERMAVRTKSNAPPV